MLKTFAIVQTFYSLESKLFIAVTIPNLLVKLWLLIIVHYRMILQYGISEFRRISKSINETEIKKKGNRKHNNISFMIYLFNNYYSENLIIIIQNK